MRQLAAASLICSIVTAGGAAAMYVSCPGCIDRSRVNAACEWRGDPASPLDLGTRSDLRHLSHDAQLAEELAIRRADVEFERRSGYYGHGGLIGSGEFRNRCMATLVATIEKRHGVTADDVSVARGRRNLAFDIGVVIAFVPMFGLVAIGCCVAVRRRFSPDGRLVVLASTALASLAASLVGVQLLELWLAVWETVRVGNGHISVFRAATGTRWDQNHHAAAFAAGVVLFWAVSVFAARIESGYVSRRSVLNVSALINR